MGGRRGRVALHRCRLHRCARVRFHLRRRLLTGHAGRGQHQNGTQHAGPQLHRVLPASLSFSSRNRSNSRVASSLRPSSGTPVRAGSGCWRPAAPHVRPPRDAPRLRRRRRPPAGSCPVSTGSANSGRILSESRSSAAGSSRSPWSCSTVARFVREATSPGLMLNSLRRAAAASGSCPASDR